MHRTITAALGGGLFLASCGGPQDAPVSPTSPYQPEILEPAVPAEGLIPEQLIAEDEAPQGEAYRRWTCEADPGGLSVTFHGPGQAQGRGAWQGPGHRRYNVDPIYVPAQGLATVTRGQTIRLGTPAGACGGSHQVDWKTKGGADGCWDFVDLPPCTEPTPEPTPSPTPEPSPTPPVCQDVSALVVTHLTHAGNYRITRNGETWIEQIWLATGMTHYIKHPEDGSLLCVKHNNELIGCATASCEAQPRWSGDVSFHCERICEE